MFTAISAAAMAMSPTAAKVQETYNELAYITGYCSTQYVSEWQRRNYLQVSQLLQIPEGAAILKQAQPIYERAAIEGRAFIISKHQCYMRNEPALENFKQALFNHHMARSTQ